jgi:hypothetical protein
LTATAWSDEPLAGTYDAGFKLQTADRAFSMRLTSAIQFRYTYMWFDDRVAGNEHNYSNFFMRRARLWWSGHAFDPRFTFYFHIQLEPTRTVNAHDLWLEYAFSDLLRLGVGRNKIAYGLEFLNSGFGLNLVERSLMYGETDIDFGTFDLSDDDDTPIYPGGGTARFGLTWIVPETGFATGGMTLYRSQGIQLRGRRDLPNTTSWEYQVGLWQGRSSVGLSNDDDKHLVSARFGFYPFGRIDWTLQGDGLSSPHWRLGITTSAYTASSTVNGGFTERGYNLAIENRYRGFSADLEWAVERFDYDRYSDDFEREGWRVHLGYFVIPAKLEVVTRYAEIERLKNPTRHKAVDSGLDLALVRSPEGDFVEALEERTWEVTAGVALYLNQWHQHKVILDASRLVREFAADPDAGIARAPDQVDHRLRTMVQFKF